MKILIHKEYLKQELFTLPVLFASVSIAVVYLFLSTLLLNYRLLAETFSGNYEFGYKTGMAFSLLKGVFILYTPFELTLILLLGFLMGINTVLIIKSLCEQRLRTGSWSFGLGFLGVLVTTGCASCGITFLSVVGPSVSLSLLPFQGISLQFVSLGLLCFSLVHTLNRRARGCIIAKR